MEKQRYPSDISREQFECIGDELERVRKRTKPRQVDLYDVFCGLLYVLKSGCQWRMIPVDYSKWRTIYAYFCKWNARPSQGGPSVLERVLKKMSGCGPRSPWEVRKNEFLHY